MSEHAGNVSQQCAANMHLHCPIPLTCKCPMCHNRCSVCGQLVRSVIELPDHPAIVEEFRGTSACDTCYRTFTALLPKGQGCETCGAAVGYRNLSDPRGLYECHECHVASGTAAEWTVSPP